MDKLNILWDAHVVSNDGKNFLHNADPCHHIAVNMSKLIGCIMTSNVEHTDYILDGRISRYEFDMPYWQERLKDVDVLITDQSTHIRNLKVANPKVTIYMLTPFIDIQKHPKVEEPYRYYLRQTDSMLVADKVVAQSGFNAVEYVKQVNQLTGVDISDKILIWPWGYSQEEVDKYKNINSFAVPTIFFPNRITESTDNYHYREFADAIGMIPEDIAKKAIFIYRNPTRKVTANQVKTIKKLSKNRADIIPNKEQHTRREYMEFINASHCSVHLCTKTHRGMSHDESAAMGNITISPNLGSSKEFWAGHKDYPFLLHKVLDHGIDSKELSRLLILYIDVYYNNQRVVSELSHTSIMLAKQFSYESVFKKIQDGSEIRVN